MKKVYTSIAALSLCAQVLMAQSPANRTAGTVVADVLAQMPVKEQAEYNKVIKDLAATGEAGVEALVKMMKAPGKGSNAAVEYALSGLSHYVSAQGNEKERRIVAEGYLKALSQTEERETKAFILRQLEVMGGDECVEPLAEYLHDRLLSGPAARALSAIGTSQVGEVLTAALKQRMGTAETQANIIRAIAQMKATGAEELLLAFVGNSDMSLQKVALYALGQVGTTKSLKSLAGAAAKAGYTMEKGGANEAYIALLNRLAKSVDTRKVAEKAATALLKDATAAGQTQSRDAALLLEMALGDKKKSTKLLLKALTDPSAAYRNAALVYASDFADGEVYASVSKYMLKARTDQQVDIIAWLGREAGSETKRKELNAIQVRSGVSLVHWLVQQLEGSGTYAVKEASVWTLVFLRNQEAVLPIAGLLDNNDKQLVLLAEDALAAFPGRVDDAIAKVITNASDAGKIAALHLLAKRKADSKLNTVLIQIQTGSPEVKQAAYAALKDVVTEKDLDTLYGMLEKADAASVLPIQEAIVSAVSAQPPAQQSALINKRLSQAGSKGYLYYYPLTATGDAKVLPFIEKEFKETKGEAHAAALDALLAWKGTETLDILYEIGRTEKDKQVFDKILAQYIKLASASSLTGENRLIRLRMAMEIAKDDVQRNSILKQIEGTGTFQAVVYAGRFLDDKPVQQAAAQAVMNIALAHPEYAGTNVRALLAKVSQVLDNPDAQYQRQSIKKYLDEIPEEIGFVSIFNGKDLKGWKGLVQNPIARAKMSPAELAKEQKKADEVMRSGWTVENGVLVFNGKGDNLCTDKLYGDFEMYVDWMLDPAGPEADAGIYLRGTPQVQIWDTARVDVGAQVGSGGLYNNRVNRSTPLKVADNRLGEWNSFYIKMVGDRVTVLLNGEKVVDDVIMENYWDRKLPIFPTGEIELQAHGSKVYYRDIYVKELKRAEPFRLSAEEEKEGFKVLFDGTNMHQWTGNTVDYTIEDGCIAMNPSKHFGGNLYTKNEYANFVFRFEYQLTPGANNGVGLRTPMEGDAAYVGMESQILDCEHPIYEGITKYQHHGSIYGILPAVPDHDKAIKPVGEWNQEEIVCDGDNIRVTVNGVVIVEGNIREATKNGTPDHKEHPGLFNKKGHIGFLGHGSPLKFRNIRIKELK